MMAATFPPTAGNRQSPIANRKSVGDGLKKEPLNTLQLFSLVGEIGYLIAIPAVLFGFLGAYLDERFGTSPWLLLACLALALTSSALAVWHRIKPLLNS